MILSKYLQSLTIALPQLQTAFKGDSGLKLERMKEVTGGVRLHKHKILHDCWTLRAFKSTIAQKNKTEFDLRSSLKKKIIRIKPSLKLVVSV